ncbi:hypothetical protein MKW98_000269 [Papaver atlanticum]|uniref:Piwi domain-containing protein n=1 Tax=Papaver atlanticum TaxID=357466 RepID=A0AAD4X700_9MAGN|nr:hypothetical protein MKW98_000269 [Papaver atlanticum]
MTGNECFNDLQVITLHQDFLKDLQWCFNASSKSLLSHWKYLQLQHLELHHLQFRQLIRQKSWEFLIAFLRETGQKPQRIIFYRDGVSEGQFYQFYYMGLMLFASMNLKPGITENLLKNAWQLMFGKYLQVLSKFVCSF